MKKFFLGAMLLALSATGVVKANYYGNNNNCCANECNYNNYNWCGFYFGVNSGYAWSNNSDAQASIESVDDGYFIDPANVTIFNNAGKNNVDLKGFIGGVQAGYNFLWCSFLLGLETDFNGFVLRGATDVFDEYVDFGPTGFNLVQYVSTDWLYTLRGRLGWVWCDWLIYGTGGLAVTNLKHTAVFNDSFLATGRSSGSETKTGWTAGAGFEYALCRCWTFKGEYLYVKFNNITSNSTLGGFGETNPFKHTVDLAANSFRIGVNYKL